jgi:hypothetical protein
LLHCVAQKDAAAIRARVCAGHNIWLRFELCPNRMISSFRKRSKKTFPAYKAEKNIFALSI